MPKARNDYECFECKKTILKGEEYERRVRYDNPEDKKYRGVEKGFQKCICTACIAENRYSYIDEKYNNIMKDETLIQFGMHCGTKWEDLPDDYVIFIYSKMQDGVHRDKIVSEYNRRLKLLAPSNINPLNLTQRAKKIEELKQEYIENKTANFKPLTIYMEKRYKEILEHKTISYRKTRGDDFESWYIGNSSFGFVETKTVIALYNRGLLKPIKFTDNLNDFRPIQYEAIAKDITPKKTNKLTKRSLIEWAKDNDFKIRENIVWKTNWLDANVIKLGYEFSFKTSLSNIGKCGYSVYCYGTLNEIKKFNSLELIKKIREDIFNIEKETDKYAYNRHCEVFQDKYNITYIGNDYGLGGRRTTPFYDENISNFVNKKHGID